jgi:hypothetical protein
MSVYVEIVFHYYTILLSFEGGISKSHTGALFFAIEELGEPSK